jgi:hypothetical protein
LMGALRDAADIARIAANSNRFASLYQFSCACTRVAHGADSVC